MHAKRGYVVAAVISAILLTGGLLLPKIALASQLADQTLFFTGSTPPDKALYCGIKSTAKSKKSYTLHISGTASGSDGQFVMHFLDGDTMGFSVPAGSTYSTTQALGGVPDVDNVVKITASGGVNSMMATVLTDPGTIDSFDETLDAAAAAGTVKARLDNFCTRSACDGSVEEGEAGVASAKALFGDTCP